MKSFVLGIFVVFSMVANAKGKDLEVNQSAPLFKATAQDGSVFDLSERKGKWTVLYFYPKAGTPGCTKQACAFRDSIKTIRAEGADVFGISADSVEDQAKFHKEHQLQFSLLADPDDTVINLYGAKMPVLSMAKRWTLIIDPDLKIRDFEKNVDPAADAQRVAKKIHALKTGK